MGFQPLDGLTGYFLLPLTVLIVVSLTYLFLKEDNMWNAYDEPSRDAVRTDLLGHSEEPRTLRGQRFLPFLPLAIPAIPVGLAAAGAAAAAAGIGGAAGLVAPGLGDMLYKGLEGLTSILDNLGL